MAARQPELQVKLFETIMRGPCTLSWTERRLRACRRRRRNGGNAVRLASLILRLDESGVRCVISLPKTALSGPVSVFAGEEAGQITDVLFHIFRGSTGPRRRSLFDEENIYTQRCAGADLFRHL
jgi:hypothetical protein